MNILSIRNLSRYRL